MATAIEYATAPIAAAAMQAGQQAQAQPVATTQLHPTDQADAAAVADYARALAAPAAPQVDPNRVAVAPSDKHHETKPEKREQVAVPRAWRVPRPDEASLAASPMNAPPSVMDYARSLAQPAPPRPPPAAHQTINSPVLPWGSRMPQVEFQDPDEWGPPPPPPAADQTINSPVPPPGSRMPQVEFQDPDAAVNPQSLTFAKPAATATPAPSSFVVPGSGAATVVPAHNVAIVDPKLQEQEQGLYGAAGRHLLEQGEQRTNAGLQIGRAQGGVVNAEQERAKAVQDASNAQQASVSPIEEHQMQTMRQIAQMHLTDPDTRGWGKRIADSIGAGLSAAGMGLLHQSGPNPVLERIHSDIDREVSRQQEEFTRKKGQLQDQNNIWAQVYKRTGDAAQATAVSKQIYTDAAKAQVDQVSTISKAPGARIDAQVLKDGIDQTAMAQTIKENPRVQAYTVGGTSPADALKRRTDLITESAKTGTALTPFEANRLEVFNRTGKDPNPEAGPLPTYGKTGTGGAPLDPNSIPKLGGTSTNWDLARNIQGTKAFENKEKQAAYNTEVLSFAKNNLGLRIPGDAEAEDIPAVEAFAVKPGDSQETIDKKQKAFAAAIARHPRPAAKGGGGTAEEPEP
jgi:hypothetical protein